MSTSWQVNLLTCQPPDISASWHISLLTYQPPDISASWHISLLTYQPPDISTAWHINLLTYQPPDISISLHNNPLHVKLLTCTPTGPDLSISWNVLNYEAITSPSRDSWTPDLSTSVLVFFWCLSYRLLIHPPGNGQRKGWRSRLADTGALWGCAGCCCRWCCSGRSRWTGATYHHHLWNEKKVIFRSFFNIH